MGCIFIGVFFDAGNGQTFRQEKGLHRRFVDLGRGRSAELLLWRRFRQLCRFLVPGVLRLSIRHSLNWALVSDTVEYGEWRTGVRSEGTVYTGFTFFRKVSQALAGFFPGWMLTQIG
ncbi:hypothetical protein T481_11390, partial [Enterococcus faecalis PF3]